MSINPVALGMFDLARNHLKMKWNEISICELGNQYVYKINDKQKEFKWGTGKKYFTKLGANHISIDINAKDGAIPLDLSKLIPKEYFSMFDIVSNCGTTEHISDQYSAFLNIHCLLGTGGVAVHSLPVDGYWPNHCPYRYVENFPQIFCQQFKYNLIYFNSQMRRPGAKLINFIVEKTSESVFADKEIKGITFKSDYKRNTDNLF